MSRPTARGSRASRFSSQMATRRTRPSNPPPMPMRRRLSSTIAISICSTTLRLSGFDYVGDPRALSSFSRVKERRLASSRYSCPNSFGPAAAERQVRQADVASLSIAHRLAVHSRRNRCCVRGVRDTGCRDLRSLGAAGGGRPGSIFAMLQNALIGSLLAVAFAILPAVISRQAVEPAACVAWLCSVVLLRDSGATWRTSYPGSYVRRARPANPSPWPLS